MENTETSQQSLSFAELWALCLTHWRWFVLSLALCLLGAGLYILMTPPVYTRSAAVLVKEDTKGNSIASDVSAAFSDLGFGQTKVNVNNEILNFQSPDLMLEVVRRLHLATDYKLDKFFYDRTLYGETLPIRVEFLDLANNESAFLTLKPAGEGQVELSDFVRKDDKSARGQTVRGAVGDTLSTPLGKIAVLGPEYPDAPELEGTLNISRSSLYGAARAYLHKMTVALSNKNATVIDLSIEDVNTQRAAEILNTIINVYNEIWIKDKNQITTSTNEFIAERLRVIEEELGDVDRTISSYKSEQRLPDLAASAGLDMQLSAEAGKRIQDLSNQQAIARYLSAYIRDARGSLLPADAGLEESNIQAQINQYNTIQLQRNRLVESSSEANYIVQDLDRQLESLRSAILSSIDNYAISLETQLATTRGARQQADARISNNPRQAGQLLSDERQQKVKEALYLFLLQKREENELSQAFTAYNTRVVATPNGSSDPISPNKKMILLVALLLGLALPLGLLYLRETTNTTVRGRKDLENIGVPFLGELPAAYKPKKTLLQRLIPALYHPSDNPEERQIIVKAHSRNIINEAFRVVRTNLEFMQGREQNGAWVVMFTSMNPGSGKTFTSANLATAFAIKGKRTIVVDMDLRKQSLSEFAGKPKTGLSDYLNGRVPGYKDLIVKDINGTGLDILPVGTLPPNPAELLASPLVEQMINELKGEYDYILLDCPPVEIVTDADLIARLADCTVFIVRAGLLERAMLPEIEKYYTAKRYRNMAVLLNGTDGGGRYGYKYGYQYGYKYGYRYGSHYGNADEEKA